MLLFEERDADEGSEDEFGVDVEEADPVEREVEGEVVEVDGIRKPSWHKIVSFNLEKFIGTLQLLIPH